MCAYASHRSVRVCVAYECERMSHRRHRRHRTHRVIAVTQQSACMRPCMRPALESCAAKKRVTKSPIIIQDKIIQEKHCEDDVRV